MKIITDEKCAGYARAGHPERPQRITATVECLQKQPELPLTWVVPTNVSDGQILRAHTPEMLARLKSRKISTPTHLSLKISPFMPTLPLPPRWMR